MNRSKWGIGADSVLLGLGLGGFFDGIILHQILQWHHMLSAVKPVDTVRGLEINTLGDGLFHLGTYIFTIAGLVLEEVTSAALPSPHDNPHTHQWEHVVYILQGSGTLVCDNQSYTVSEGNAALVPPMYTINGKMRLKLPYCA
jgi:hypothetical protein